MTWFLVGFLLGIICLGVLIAYLDKKEVVYFDWNGRQKRS